MTTRESGSGIERYRGFSFNDKPREGAILEDDDLLLEEALPRTIKAGSVYTEIDTGARFYWNGIDWIKQNQTVEVLLGDLIDQIADAVQELKVIRQATTIQANGAWEAEIPTGLDN